MEGQQNEFNLEISVVGINKIRLSLISHSPLNDRIMYQKDILGYLEFLFLQLTPPRDGCTC